MEKRTKHRILGVLVVIGLVLISMPLFQGGKEETVNTALVKAPAFPDQVSQANTTPEEIKFQTVQSVQPSPIPIVDPSKSNESNNDINQQPDDTIKVNPTNPVPNSTVPNSQPPAMTGLAPEKNSPEAPEVNNPARPKMNSAQTQPVQDKAVDPTPDSEASPEGTDYIFKNSTPPEEEVTQPPAVNTKKTKVISTQHIRVLKMHPASSVSKPINIENNGLFKLKSAVWVIQMGSFKNKDNALRLVNKLRLNGYRAFIQQASSYTQVFVGPENKQNSARVLKNKLEAELHISGVVVSYKPLKL